MPSIRQIEVSVEKDMQEDPLICISQWDAEKSENDVIYLEPYQLDLFLKMLADAKREIETYGVQL